MITRDDILIIGKFQKTHALKGELNMISDLDPEYFLEGKPMILDYDGILVPYYVESIRPKGSTSFLVKLEGIQSEEDASPFVNKEIGVIKKDAEEWLDDEIMDSNDLIGFVIIDSDTGNELGKISRIEDSTSNLLFIIETPEGEEIFIPANEDFILEIDEDEKFIKMNLPEGLIDLNRKE